MSILNSVFILFYTTLMHSNSAIDTIKSFPSNKQWITMEYDAYKPSIVALENRIILVGLLENTVKITSIDGLPINTCKFTLPPNQVVKSDVVRPLALGNGKIVVRTLTSQMVTDAYQSPSDSPAWDLFIIVDLINCSSTKTLELSNKGWKADIAAVIPYHDSFDVFYRMFSTPRRFNDQAEPIDLDGHLDLKSGVSGFHVETIKPFDASEGYICTMFSSIDSTTSLHRLDSNFQMVKKAKVQPWATAMTVTDDNVILCYITTNEKNQDFYKYDVICNIYDIKDLDHRFTVRLHQPKSLSNKILKPEVVKMIKLPIGVSVAVIAFKHPDMNEDEGQTTEYYLQRINADGNTTEAVHIGTGTSFFDLMSVVSLGGDKVCLTVVSEIEPRFGFKSVRCNVISKCFNVL